MPGEAAKRLLGWKAIAAFLGRDVRTARRWEQERGLPVHRLPGGGSASVWADPDALASWMQGASGVADDASAVSRRRGWWPLGLAATFVLGALFALWLAAPIGGPAPRQAAVAPEPYGADAAANDLWRRASLSRSKRSVAGLREAEAQFSDLVRRYPDVAAGYIGQAETFLLLREFNSMPEESAYRRASMAIAKALALTPDAPQALRAQAFIRYWNDGERAEALRLFERALAAAPDDPQTHHWYGTALMGEGQPDRALHELETAARLNPESSAIAADLAYGRYLAGEHARAVATLHELVRADPGFVSGHSYLERIALIEGRNAEFLDAARASARLRQDSARLAVLDQAAAAFDKGGRKAMVEALIASSKQRFDQDGASALRLAMLYVAAGNRAAALEWLNRAEESREPDIRVLRSYIEFAGVRDDPAFAHFFPRS